MRVFPGPTVPSSSETFTWPWGQATWLVQRPCRRQRRAFTVAGQRRIPTDFAVPRGHLSVVTGEVHVTSVTGWSAERKVCIPAWEGLLPLEEETAGDSTQEWLGQVFGPGPQSD